MILDLSKRTLSYQINNGKIHNVFTDITINNAIGHCMGVCIGGHHTCIKLLSYRLSQQNNLYQIAILLARVTNIPYC